MIDLNLGVHLSLGPRPLAAIQDACDRGATCLQIFASSPGAWKPPNVPAARAEACSTARQECNINPIVIHAIYLINLASADELLVRRSRSSLIATMHAAVQLGAAGLITHIGSHGGRGYEAVADLIAEGLVEVLESTPLEVDLMLENSAGAGGIVGSTLEELADLVARCGKPERLKIALDTAHLCGAVWDFTVPETAPALVAEIESTFGLQRLAILHANDSKVPPGSHKDRHAIVGDGYIGLDGFRHLLGQPALTAVPWILETPDLDSERAPENRFISLDRLRELTRESTAGERREEVSA